MRNTVLDVSTVVAAIVGLLVGTRLATAGQPAVLSILGSILTVTVVVRLGGRGVLALVRRRARGSTHSLGDGTRGSRRAAAGQIGAAGRTEVARHRGTAGQSGEAHSTKTAPHRRTRSGARKTSEGRPTLERGVGDIPPEALVAGGRPEEAVRMYRDAAEAAPRDPEPWMRIARIERLHLERPRAALDALHRARERLPADSPEAGRVALEIADLHIQHLRDPSAAMPELARAARFLAGTTAGDGARRELTELKQRLTDGEFNREEMRTPPPPPDLLQELDVLIRTRYGLILIHTEERQRAESLLRHVADHRRLPLFVWSPSKGLARHDTDEAAYDTRHPAKALRHIEAARIPALYYLPSLRSYLERDDPELPHHLADAVGTLEEGEGAIVLAGSPADLPPEIRDRAAVLRLPGPEAGDYRALLGRVLRDVESRMSVEVQMTIPEQTQLLTNLRGLTLMEAEKLLTRIIVEDGRLASGDVEKVMDAKRAVIEREGVLEYYPTETEWTEIADLAGLKAWLRQRRAVVAEPNRAAEFGLSFPKGILLLGVPGCGKSLCAKAVAMDWRLPLLRLDPSDLYNKYIGETEKNFRRAMETAERMAPLVLWIDEVEKAFAAGEGEDGGVSRRVLGTFLSWMQERTGEVFVVATANDVQRLPAEFLRKGRFDETFFVDLPDGETRAAIFAVHLRRRGQDPTRFEVEKLAAATEGFSGAEIEQVVVSGLFHAFAEEEGLGTERLLKEASQTRPLSVTMAERVEGLRRWARGRTRSAQVAE